MTTAWMLFTAYIPNIEGTINQGLIARAFFVSLSTPIELNIESMDAGITSGKKSKYIQKGTKKSWIIYNFWQQLQTQWEQQARYNQPKNKASPKHRTKRICKETKELQAGLQANRHKESYKYKLIH